MTTKEINWYFERMNPNSEFNKGYEQGKKDGIKIVLDFIELFKIKKIEKDNWVFHSDDIIIDRKKLRNFKQELMTDE